VLSLQGDFERHGAALAELGVEAVGVRRPEHLGNLEALIVPGGESTTMLRLLDATGLRAPLEAFVERRPVLGTCAGLILLAKEAGVLPAPTLGLLDVAVERNGYGRQIDSFSCRIEVPALGGSFDAVFIRAPRLRRIGKGVEVLARASDGEPVGVRSGRVAGLAFHPELTPDRRLHRWFLTEMAGLELPAEPVTAARGMAGRA
jgi:5'-phosphate synthase pdxT subunit